MVKVLLERIIWNSKKSKCTAYGLKLVNQDKELVRMLNKYGFGTDLDDMLEELFRQLTILITKIIVVRVEQKN